MEVVSTEPIRLQKYIAMCGVASRRAAEALILAGAVKVNGQTVTEMGTKVTERDNITVNGEVIHPEKKKYYIMINKPKGVICAVSDDRERECVVDLVKDVPARLFPVGRLDYDTSGLLLLTNDGDFMQKLTHPSFEVWKTYRAVVKGVPTEKDVQRFAEGVLLEDGMTEPAVLDVVGYKGKNAIAEISIREGRNRQVRRMMEACGHPVLSLERISVAALELGDLKPGKWRFLRERDFELLFGSQD